MAADRSRWTMGDLANWILADAFPSSAAFDLINTVLINNEAERKDAIDKAKTIVGISLKNSKGEEASWYVDVKDKGIAGAGPAPPGGKADGMPLILYEK